MKIEAVTVCVDYADFLTETIGQTLNAVDRLVVVTTPADKETQELCRKWSVDCYPTHVFFEDGDVFNKGRAINYGLAHLRHDQWILHLDADIYLPHRFRQMLRYTKLREDTIYGMDRLNTRSYENWRANKWRTEPQHQYRFMVTPTEQFPVGSRLVHQELGFLPCGYFQLFHQSHKRVYSVNTGGAEHSDAMFAAQWEKRTIIPEAFCYHLESESGGAMGKNWRGRRTKRFGPGGGEVKRSEGAPGCASACYVVK